MYRGHGILQKIGQRNIKRHVHRTATSCMPTIVALTTTVGVEDLTSTKLMSANCHNQDCICPARRHQRAHCTLHSTPGRYYGKVYEAMRMLGPEENPLSSVVNLTSDIIINCQKVLVVNFGIISVSTLPNDTAMDPITMDNAVRIRPSNAIA
ncbi:2637_t:CDS:2 [Paraglomus occultum]|uniref:2637_t:CDS:1 n=1 Tax=Paraglomus occultum TaxID=144539 RepID=A0A9N9C433_9GLOM|nr:2637_t:CDS:2 [Paraglomus occultum]